MPTYEYRREDGTVFEHRQGINEKPLTACPESGQKVKRIISGGGGVLYKGDGWYVTDYKKNNGSSAPSDSSASESAESDAANSAAASSPERTKSEKNDTKTTTDS
ncbi:MAG: zinc ribbon domain-containing protein [Balneolaceae bacterium]